MGNAKKGITFTWSDPGAKSVHLQKAMPSFSFEFYPPKTDKATAFLFSTLEELSALDPPFVSIAYRADGSSRERTLEVVRRLQREIGVESMAHLTCRGHSREDVERILQDLEHAGIRSTIQRSACRFRHPEGATGARRISLPCRRVLHEILRHPPAADSSG
ncbi:MAG: methylenetetrahydrofolate reductase [Acidobacteria bacterium]|nr:methylenetetrahydrofolate reductase [Acidobacteriota bacterium]